jgi:hypothetical protein
MVRTGDKVTIADLAALIVTSGQFRNVAGRDAETPAVTAKPAARTVAAIKTSEKAGTP